MLCEKPLGRDADEAYEIWSRVAATGVKHLCGFNYRFVPAVRLAREMIEAGELGEIRHFRARYLQDWAEDPGSTRGASARRTRAGGAIGDLATHVVDLARFLVGEISALSGVVKTFVPGRRVDDAIEAVVEFESGTIGTIEATRLALGRRNAFQWEINGSKGSLWFDMERMNELQVFRADGDRARGAEDRARDRGRPSVLPVLLAARATSPAGATPSCTRSCHLLDAIANDGEVASVRGRLRGRLPRQRALRRDRPLVERRRPRRALVPLARLEGQSPSRSAASCVPSTRARIFANAVSRAVAVVVGERGEAAVVGRPEPRRAGCAPPPRARGRGPPPPTRCAGRSGRSRRRRSAGPGAACSAIARSTRGRSASLASWM